MRTVRFGIFDNFKGRTTLLIWGDDAGLAELRLAFGELAAGRRLTLPLNKMHWAEAVRNVRVDLSAAGAGDGNIRLTFSAEGPVVDWRCSSKQFAQFADQLTPLVSPGSVSGHEYLDMQSQQPLQVMVSKGEYSPDIS